MGDWQNHAALVMFPAPLSESITDAADMPKLAELCILYIKLHSWQVVVAFQEDNHRFTGVYLHHAVWEFQRQAATPTSSHGEIFTHKPSRTTSFCLYSPGVLPASSLWGVNIVL